jgi:hypothetical protein
MRFLSAAAVAWAVLCAATSARDLYVDNVAGDDRNDGSVRTSSASGQGPCRTIARALREANTSDRIVLANSGEPYRESITLQAKRHSGTPERPFQLVGQGAILEGARDVPPRIWEHVHGDLFRFAPMRKAYQLLFLDGKPVRSVPSDPRSPQLPDLQPLESCYFERALYFRTEQGRMPQTYALTHSSLPTGITLYEVRNVVLSDLIVQGFQVDGINAQDSVYNTVLRDVRCRGNARSGISIGGASQVTIEGCLVGGNGLAQVRTEGHSHTRIVDSDLLDKSAPALVREGGQVDVQKSKPGEAPQSSMPSAADKTEVSSRPSRQPPQSAY